MSTQQATAPIAPEMALKIPAHLGVIMDGNGRWAQQRGLSRSDGHRAGVEAVRRMVKLCITYGVDYLTLFSFSAENWRRPPEEINFIFGLLRRFVATDLDQLHSQNVKIRVIGERETLEPGLRKIITDVENRTKNNTGLNLIIAFNYGAKAELARAMKSIATQVEAGEISASDVTEDLIAQHLDTRGVPDPDLILRTSGEMRLSNFLLWQAAYAELVFVGENWPDFDESVFVDALKTYTARERRFGGVGT